MRILRSVPLGTSGKLIHVYQGGPATLKITHVCQGGNNSVLDNPAGVVLTTGARVQPNQGAVLGGNDGRRT